MIFPKHNTRGYTMQHGPQLPQLQGSTRSCPSDTLRNISSACSVIPGIPHGSPMDPPLILRLKKLAIKKISWGNTSINHDLTES